MKIERQKAILRIISEQEIGTQEELLEALKAEGIKTTQATISRDITEMNLRKKPAGMGRQKYLAPERSGARLATQSPDSYRQVLSSGITGTSIAGNIVVVKTFSGMAMAVGSAIDNMKIEGVAGCVAGDDTIFVAVTDATMAERVVSEIHGGI